MMYKRLIKSDALMMNENHKTNYQKESLSSTLQANQNISSG